MEIFRLILACCLFFTAVISADDVASLQSCQKEYCGHQILEDKTGTINFRSDEIHYIDFRCSWIIRTPNATDYVLQMSGYTSVHKLTVIGFTHTNTVQQRITTTSPISISANVILVTFHSSSSDSTLVDFSLSYEAHFTSGESKSSLTSRDFFLCAHSGWEKHPREDGFYGINEETLFVLTPYNYVMDPSVIINVTIGITSVGETCQDKFIVYSLNPHMSSGYEWEEMTDLCIHTTTYTMTTRDMMLLRFRSNNDDTIKAHFDVFYERYAVAQRALSIT